MEIEIPNNPNSRIQQNRVQEVTQNEQIFIQYPIKTLKHSYIIKNQQNNNNNFNNKNAQTFKENKKQKHERKNLQRIQKQDRQDTQNNSENQRLQEIQELLKNPETQNNVNLFNELQEEALTLEQIQLQNQESYQQQQQQQQLLFDQQQVFSQEQQYGTEEEECDLIEIDEFYEQKNFRRNQYNQEDSNKSRLANIYNGLSDKMENQRLVQQNTSKPQLGQRISDRESYDRVVSDQVPKLKQKRHKPKITGLFNFENWQCSKTAIPVSEQSLWRDKPDLRLKKAREYKQKIGCQIVSFLKNVLHQDIIFQDGQKNDIYENYFYDFLEEIHNYDYDLIIETGKKIFENQKKQCFTMADTMNQQCENFKNVSRKVSQFTFNIFNDIIETKLIQKIDKIGDFSEILKNLEIQFETINQQYQQDIVQNVQYGKNYKIIRDIIKEDKQKKYRIDTELLLTISENIENSLKYYQIINDYEQQAIQHKIQLQQLIKHNLERLENLIQNIKQFTMNFIDDSNLDYFNNKIQHALQRVGLPEYQNFSNNQMLDQVISKRYNITIKVADIRTLMPQKWLNDNIINCYAKLLQEKAFIMNSCKKDVLLVTSQFFNKFFSFEENNSNVQVYSHYIDPFLQKFRQEKNSLFLDYKRVGFIICVENHWIFIGVDNESKEIRYYDSMPHSVGRKYQKFTEAIKILIIKENENNVEYKQSRKSMKTEDCGYTTQQVKCPSQDNGFDCGVFVCKNMQQFTYNQKELSNNEKNYKQKDITEFRKNLYYLFPLLGSCSGIPDFDVIDYLEKGNSKTLVYNETLKKNKSNINQLRF